MVQRGRKDRIDVDRALELRAERMSWREIGMQLAADSGRPVPYLASAVREAAQPSPAKVAKVLARRLR